MISYSRGKILLGLIRQKRSQKERLMALISYKQNLNERRQFKFKTMILKCFAYILAGESSFKLETRRRSLL